MAADVHAQMCVPWIEEAEANQGESAEEGEDDSEEGEVGDPEL